MLKILIITIIQLLGFKQNNTKSLHPKQNPTIKREQVMILLIPIALLIFVTLIILFIPSTESGLVYNGELA